MHEKYAEAAYRHLVRELARHRPEVAESDRDAIRALTNDDFATWAAAEGGHEFADVLVSINPRDLDDALQVSFKQGDSLFFGSFLIDHIKRRAVKNIRRDVWLELDKLESDDYVTPYSRDAELADEAGVPLREAL